MSKIVEWSRLPEELVDEIANHLFSNVELLRVRSICKSWRAAVATNKHFPNRHNRNRKRFLSPSSDGKTRLLAPAAFFRVIPSSSPKKGWLIKTRDVSETSKELFCPFSGLPIDASHQTLDLLEFTVSEIYQTYEVHEYLEELSTSISYSFARVVLVDNLVFGVDRNKKIWWCNSGESNNNNVWTRISNKEAKYFDIIVHKGQVFALDLKGAIWWISLSELDIFQYGPQTPMQNYEIDGDYEDKRLVEYCGDLCIVHRFYKIFRVDRAKVHMTIGFKVYKMDEESVEWVQLKSLGDTAFVMAMGSCFSVLAREYYGCLENSIYFTDDYEDMSSVKIFKLGDGSITTMVMSSPETCFHMFFPPFV